MHNLYEHDLNPISRHRQCVNHPGTPHITAACLERRYYLLTLLAAGWGHSHAQNKPPSGSVRVVAASDLKFALDDLVARFTSETSTNVSLYFGSSGSLAAQIRQGLPADLFMSADESLVYELHAQGLLRNTGALYGEGRIALIASAQSQLPLDENFSGVRTNWAQVNKFAIANPQHAPYGRAAKEALQKWGVWDFVQSKLILGENISQATQFITTGAAQVGITALSLVLTGALAPSTRYLVLPNRLHSPLKQRMALTKNASEEAAQFFVWLQSPGSKLVLQKYGFATL